jgi:hypothetical protein
MNYRKPTKPVERADSQPANPLWVITAMLAVFAAATAAIIALG